MLGSYFVSVVVVSLVRACMVDGNNFLWESLMFKKLGFLHKNKIWKDSENPMRKGSLSKYKNLLRFNWTER